MEKEQLQQLLDSKGWEIVERMINIEIAKMKDATNISPNIRNDVYAREVRTGVKAAESLQGVLNKIKLQARGISGNKKSVADYD